MTGKCCIIAFLLPLLLACGGSKSREMSALLDRADSMNQSYVPMTDGIDSLLRQAALYYDRHGSPNQQMRAYYLLASAYRDMGESPRALDIFHEAADRADTTSADCNFALLARVHGQMAALFEDYALPRNQLEEERIAYRYAMMARDTTAALAFFNKQASCYGRLGIEDSVLYYSEEACKRYMEVGDTLRANTSLGSAAAVYLDRKEYVRAKEYLDRQEYHSTLTNDKPFREKNHYQLYYNKGEYYTAMNQYDSAAIAYYKLLHEGETPNNILLGYHGLFGLYRQMDLTDSMLKYATLHTQFNDTFVSRLESSKLQSAQSLYNYTRHQQIAERESAHSARLQSTLWIGSLLFLSLLLSLVFVIYILRVRIKARLRRMASRYAMDMLLYQETTSRLHLLKSQQNKDMEQIALLEAELNELRQALASQQADHKQPEEWGMQEELLNSPIILRFHKQATIGATVTDGEWHELRRLANEQMPGFMSAISNSNYHPSLRETNVCILEKLRFASSEQAALLEVSAGAISNIHRRLTASLFGKEPSAKEFRTIIGSLPY